MKNLNSFKWNAAIIALAMGVAGCAETPSGNEEISAAETAVMATSTVDPRQGLAAGLEDAGTAILNLKLVQEIAMPDGFYEPNSLWAPAVEMALVEKLQKGEEVERPPSPISFANTDLAFSGDKIVMGNFHGFNIYQAGEQDKLDHVVSVVCPGGQGDVSIHGDLVFLSVEANRARLDCGSDGVEGDSNPDRFLGVRIFDISDIMSPRQVAAVQTCRGSHTHTLVPDPEDPDTVYIYVSGAQDPRPGSELDACSAGDPDENPETALYSIDVIKVPVKAPAEAAVVSRPRIFADAETGEINGLWKGGKIAEDAQDTSVTNHCHDITAFPKHNLAAGACAGNGILLDISDPVNPTRISEIGDPNMAYWHSAVFNNEADSIVFTDEWGGGLSARCLPEDPTNWGGNLIADITADGLKGRGFFKIPNVQSETENCVAHNGSLIPVPGRDIKVQSWYSGGISIIDFTNPENTFEIAYFDRGPISADELYLSGYWAAYWHNGKIYAPDIVRGLDVFELVASEFISEDEIAAAKLVTFEEANTQTQEYFEWPATPLVANVYFAQLKDSHALSAELITAISAAMAGEMSKAEVARRLRDAAKLKGGQHKARLMGLANTLDGLEA